MTGEDNNGFMLAWQERAADGFEAIAASEPTWQSRVALQAALRILQGIPVNSFYRLQVPTITSETLEQYVRPEYSDAYWTNSLLPKDAYWTNSLLPKEVADEIYMEASS